jgi:hypothetical protein
MSGDVSPIRLELDVPSEAPIDVPLALTLRLVNGSNHAVELTLRGRTIAFDVTVRRRSGAVVWRRLENAVIPAIARLEVLGPREVLTLRAVWDLSTSDGAPAPAGEYLVEGVLFTDGPDLRTPPTPLRLTPP